MPRNQADEDDDDESDPNALPPEPPVAPRSDFESGLMAVCALGVLALGVFVSVMMLGGVGLAATGVGAGAGPIMLCVPAPALAAFILGGYIWRQR